MSNYSRVQDNFNCVADDFEHEVEVDDSENDSPTICHYRKQEEKVFVIQTATTKEKNGSKINSVATFH